MLSTVTLAASQDLFPVWLGSTLGMVISDGLAIGVGRILGKQLPERAIKIGAALIFVGFGFFYSVLGGMDLWDKYRSNFYPTYQTSPAGTGAKASGIGE